jgi:hypothetical protein
MLQTEISSKAHVMGGGGAVLVEVRAGFCILVSLHLLL